ncbi:uncharacterized protein LOC112543732 [Pelodiscus sinensis]|uniref:uncharacterized protein LOC112543732 n=1 Tax=Pelodiscus sinensis TaxID=13735 RepID=UPI003F6AEE7F
MKKNSEKQKEMKTRLSHWVTKRPASGIVGQKPTPRRTLSDQDINTRKRMFIQNRHSGWSNSYASHSEIPAESRCYSAPPKPAVQQNSGSPYNPGTRGEDSTVTKRRHHIQPAQAQRYSDFSRLGENKRLTPEELEKKRYQTIAQYQFMTPGKTFYYCTRENVKQHLRSIYLAHQPGQKPPKSALRINRPPVFTQERHRSPRKSPLPGASGLVSGEFPGDVSSLHTPSMSHCMIELVHKVSKLALVSERRCGHQEILPKRKAVEGSHEQQLPATEKPIPSATELQASSAMDGKGSQEDQALEQGFSMKTLPQGSGIKMLQALKAVQGIINKGREASHTLTVLKKKPGTGNSQVLTNAARLSSSKDSAERKDMAEDLLSLPQSSDKAIIIPMLDSPLTPEEESTDLALLPTAHSSNSELAESPAGEKGQASHPTTVRASDQSSTSPWKKPAGVPKCCISTEKGHECCTCPSEPLQGPRDPENEKEGMGRIDNLSVPF